MNPVECPDKIPADGGKKTSDIYKVKNLPPRFDNPCWFTAYGSQKQQAEHPFYRTTTREYGWFPPNVHTVSTSYFPRNTTFSTRQAFGGMYKNYSLNTALDTSVV